MTNLDKIDDLMLAQYLADRFDIPALPGYIKRKLTIKEQLKEAEKSRNEINAIIMLPRRRRRI